ncbi:MAG: hypothetical protein ACYC2H_05185 [Thermoplasmatota archaeon]
MGQEGPFDSPNEVGPLSAVGDVGVGACFIDLALMDLHGGGSAPRRPTGL